MATSTKARFRLKGLRELSSVALTIYVIFFVLGGPIVGETFEDGLWTVFWAMMVFGGYIWIQDLGAATDESLHPTRQLIEAFTSLIPVLVIGYALFQHLIGETPLALPNLLILIGGLLFTFKDFAVGMLLVYRLLFLTDDFRGRIDTPNT